MSSEFQIHFKRLLGLSKRIVIDIPALIKGGLAEKRILLGNGLKRLEEYRDIHASQVAFMLGNGPSVRLPDLERLQGHVTFCCNRFHLSYSGHSLRPTYTLSGDRQMIEDFGPEICQNSHGPVFFNHIGVRFQHANAIWVHQRWAPSLSWFSTNAHCGIAPVGGTLLFGIQLAYFMGIRHMVLYGVDHSFKYESVSSSPDVARSAKGEGNHFIADYRSGKNWWPPNPDQIADSFRRCDGFLRSRGGWLVNASRQTELRSLERREFDEMVNLKSV